MIKDMSKEQKLQFVRDIQDYFSNERDEEIGIIATEDLGQSGTKLTSTNARYLLY